ncbi:MAG: VanZ family protein, partial [Oscillospiraceae bacterium]
LESILSFFRINIDTDTASFIVRKFAHGTEFAVLAVLLMLAFYFFAPLKKPTHFFITVLFIGVMVALTDEAIQLFVPGRGSDVRDVFVDFTGVVIGTIIMTTVFTIIKKRAKKGALHIMQRPFILPKNPQ